MELRETKSKAYIGGVLCGLCISCAALIIFSIFGDIKFTSKADSSKDSIITKDVESKVELIQNSIAKYYLNDYDNEMLENGIYKGILESLGDPYSTYYSREEMQKVAESTEGVYYGIGAYVALDKETEGGRITKVMNGSPAEEAGVLDGDVIVKVDGENVLGLSLSDIVSKIKGPENTQVLLSLYREGESDYIELSVTRRQIESPTVVYEMLDGHIAYIQITEFDSVTTDQFKTALEQAKADQMESLILDLRDNPGGNLTDVVAIAGEILPKGLVVYTEDKNGKRQEYRSDGKNELDVPMVVLVNGYSASASEILAGSIKDYNKGTILGTTTYGKGIVQRIYSVSDGSAIKLTVSHYYTPNGNDIHGVGIEPDETLEFDTEAYQQDGTDNQLERAKEILGGRE
ncbi:MAG: S41 family peptidase [Lachnospiraceae bacterium]|nr:S41 family peptidase [Lachnospiraceae bacterium]